MKRKRLSEAEILLGIQLAELGMPAYEREYRFAPPRQWRFDVAISEEMLAIELEGGVWTHGRHTRGKGFQDDLDKYNEALALGWRVARFSVEDVLTGKSKETLRKLA